jgi:hypothetical protein
MQTHSYWANWFVNHGNNDAGNKNIQAFSNILSSGGSNEVELQALVEDIDTVILAADSNNTIMILHSPKNLRGRRSRPKNKVVCILGVGSQGTCVLLDLKTAFKDKELIVPTVHDLAKCKSAEEVASIPASGKDGLVGFEGSAIFIPGPVLPNAIIKSNSKIPFKLIPIISNTARIFDKENESSIKAVNHADDLTA